MQSTQCKSDASYHESDSERNIHSPESDSDTAYVYDRWQARSYATLISKGRDFVNGVLKETPYHGGPLDPESKPLKPSLLDLHSMGFLTMGSQSSEDEYFIPHGH